MISSIKLKLISIAEIVYLRIFGHESCELGKKMPISFKKNLWFFCLLLFVFYSVFLFYKSGKHISDKAYFGGDTWEYQSLAVNFAKGHGLKFGAIEDFKVYNFKKLTAVEKSYKQQFLDAGEKGGTYDFYRTPLYPFFLGLTYKIFGVHPVIAREIQLLLLTFMAAFLPMIGYYFWKGKGYISGVIAGIIFLNEHYEIHREILTEVVIIFSLFLTVFAYIFFDKNKNIFSSALFGFSLALIFLAKGSTWFIPFLFFAYLLFQFYKNRIKKKILFCVILIAFAFPVILYSAFASIKSGQFVFVTTQGSQVLLDGNNEKSIKSGGWEPSGTTDPNGFYEKNKDLGTYKKVFLFYTSHLANIPEMIVNKINVGFGNMTSLYFLIMLFNCEMLFCLIKRYNYKNWFIFGSIFLGIFSFIGWAFFSGEIFYVIIEMALLLVWLLCVKRRKVIVEIFPIPFAIFFLNFLVLTVITFGLSRFTMVIEIFVILNTVCLAMIIFDRIKRIEINKLIFKQ